MSADPRITRLLTSDAASLDEELLPLVYDELRQLARTMLVRERPGQTLQPTALVHEAWLRVAGTAEAGWENRRHFFGAASEAMRRILIERARRKQRIKHGGDRVRVDAEAVELAIEPPGDDVLVVDEALQKLEQADPRARQIVNLRYFSGFTVSETAEILGLAPKTVEAEWTFIRSWLKQELADRDGGE